MKFPYGMCDFQRIITGNYFYADRTDRIPLLEEAGEQLLFLRPRRFGKSLLLSMLENYYDLNRAEKFERLFGHLAIGREPTESHNHYCVLKWDFSAVSPQGSAADIKQNLYDYLNNRIEFFALYYQDILSTKIRINLDNALSSFQSLLNAVQVSGHPLYLLIDEYDNVANEVMMNDQGGKEQYQTLLAGEGDLKALFKVIKSAAAGQGVERVFIIGVSPVVMSDITSGYNIAENIYLEPDFNDLCGFRENEIKEVLRQIVQDCDFPESKFTEAFELMRTYYNGYIFNFVQQDYIFNPTLTLYFFKKFQRHCQYPRNLLDSNLAMDRGKINYISQLPGGKEIILNALTKQQPVGIPKLADRFGVQDMLEAGKDTTFMVSLLYYFGVLTLSGTLPFADLALRIPNLVIRKLYAEQIKEMLLPDNNSMDAAQKAAQALYQQGELQPLCDFMETKYFKVFHNRDYAWSNELTIKTAFLTLLFNDIYYIMESETALERSYADLTMIVRPDMRQYELLDILLEFKYVSLKDAGLNGEQLQQLSSEQLQDLSAVQTKQQEARKGLARYKEKLDRKYGDILNLHSFSVVSVGFDRLVFSKVKL